jgi:hypothetical protein
MAKMLPKSYDLSTDKVDVIEFENSFYSEIFRDEHMLQAEKDPYRFRLCAFIDIKDNPKKWISFR